MKLSMAIRSSAASGMTSGCDHGGVERTPVPSPPSDDSIETFVQDLAELRKGRTYQALSRQTGLGHGTIHAAMTRTTSLPSAAVTERIVRHLDPAQVAAWLSRRAALSGGVTDGDQGPVPSPGAAPLAAPRVHWRALVLPGAVAASLALGGLLAAPSQVGGFDAVGYCSTYLPGSTFTHGDTYDSLACVETGIQRPLDPQLACRMGHPAWGIFGGAQYAVHTGSSWADWRCFGSPLHPLQ